MHICGPHRHTAADEALCVRKALEPPRWVVHRQVPVFVKLIRKTSEKPALLCPSRELPVAPATTRLLFWSTCTGDHRGAPL